MSFQLASYLVLGLIIIASGWLPLFLRPIPVSLPMIAVGFGALFFLGMPQGRLALEYRGTAEVLTNVVLIIAVMGAGLRIDRRFALRRWTSTWRLLAFVMPLSIAAIAACAVGLLGFSLGQAILLAAILAPTDPVLAASVQVGPPGSGDAGELRFGLTSEAGLNDGLAFPFVLLGMLLMEHGADPGGVLGRWLLVDVLWKVGAAVMLGAAVGWALVKANGLLPERFRLGGSGNGIVSVGVTFLVYGLSELIACYGLVAVFVTATTIRNTSTLIDYHRQLVDYSEQIERTATMLVLVLFGGVLVGGELAALTWADAALAALVLAVIRPAATFLGFLGSSQSARERMAFGYFGIRGIGSLYYAAYAGNHSPMDDPSRIWAIVSLVVLASVALYGVSTDVALRALATQNGDGAADRR